MKKLALLLMDLCPPMCNAHKENKRAKSVCSFSLLFFKLSLGFGLDFEFGLGLTLGLDLMLGLGLGLGLE